MGTWENKYTDLKRAGKGKMFGGAPEHSVLKSHYREVSRGSNVLGLQR